MNQPLSIPKNRYISFLSACVILLPCFSYAIIGDAPLIPILSGVFLIISIIVKQPIIATKRAVIYSLTISILITVILNETYPVDGDRFFIPMPTEILFPFVISLAICTTFFKQNSLSLTIILTLAAFSMMLHGSCVSNPSNSRFIIESKLWNNRFWVFGFTLSLQMIAFLPLLYYAQETRHRIATTTHAWKKKMFAYGLSVTLLGGGIVASCLGAEKLENLMEPFFNSVFSSFIYAYKSRIVFGKEVDLYRKTAPNVQNHLKRIVLRAKSASAPGYLRGRVFSNYHNGQWSNKSSNELTNLRLLENLDQSLSVNHFSQTQDNVSIESLTGIDVIPSKYFYSDVLLASGHSRSIEIIAETIESDNDGTLKPKDWDKHGAYTINNQGTHQDSAYNYKIEPPAPNYTEINDKLKAELQKLSITLFDSTGLSPLQKVRIVEKHLLENYEYSLATTKPGKDKDPIQNFLFSTQKGHCELFASAAALLLRTQGIPTRYVTGFICSEPHPNSEFWISRLGDCHAWVEAWLPDTQEWILVEPTPPSGIPTGNKRSGLFSAYLEHFIVFWKDGYAQIKRGYFARAVITYLVHIRNFVVWLLWSGPWFLGWTLMLVLGYLSYRFISLKYRVRTLYDRANSELYKSFKRIERYLKKFNIKRNRTTTIRETIDIVESSNIPKGKDIIELLVAYERIRYSPTPPNTDTLNNLSLKVKSTL